MNLEAIQPFIRQGLTAQLLLGKYLFTPLKTRDCRLFYILEGSGSMTIEGKSYAIGPSSVVLFQAATEYIWQIENMRYIAINFDYTWEHASIRRTFAPMRADLFPKDNFSDQIIFSDAPELNTSLVLKDGAALGEPIKALALEYHMKEDFSDVLMSALLKSIIIRLLRMYRAPEQNSGRKGIATARTAIEYIQNHFQENINNQVIAEELHFHPAYLSRVFKAHTGMSLHAFLQDYRLQAAMEMLRTQNLSIGQIAQASGFQDAAYFTRAFKNHTGKTPLEYKTSD